MAKFVISLFLLFLLSTVSAQSEQFLKEPVLLKPYATFDYHEIDESSALVKSRIWEDLFWTLNDSGDHARIFPINRNGQVYRAEWFEQEAGIRIADAVNIDWEDIATDDQGNLYIAACGNNNSIRRDLAIYVVPDPNPLYTGITRYSQKIRFFYPEQQSFPDPEMNFDCEAIFFAYDKLYLLTKHRSDTNTCLYRFDSFDPLIDNPVTKLGSYQIRGMVTAADTSVDGSRLVVLTYNAVWMFESDTDAYFDGKTSWLPISAKQCEGICFDNDTILISNEQTELFSIPVSDLILIKE